MKTKENMLRTAKVGLAGLPMGDEAFLDRLATEHGVKVRPEKRGPKPHASPGLFQSAGQDA
jgi:hypothetical protein